MRLTVQIINTLLRMISGVCVLFVLAILRGFCHTYQGPTLTAEKQPNKGGPTEDTRPAG